MIKSLSKLFNPKILVYKSRAPFTTPKPQNDTQPIPEQAIDPSPQQLEPVPAQAEVQDAVQPASEQGIDGQQQNQDDESLFDDVALFESNWDQMASTIHTNYYINPKDPRLQSEVNQKLQQIQNMYDLNLKQLQRAKIMDFKQFDIKFNIVSYAQQGNRYLQNDISQTTRIGYSTLTLKRFKQFFANNNLSAIKQLYKNNEFQFFHVTPEYLQLILERVIESNFQDHFYLNLFEFFRINQNSTLFEPNKNLQKILQNIHHFHQLNKLKFFWKLSSSLQNAHQYINWNIVDHQLANITFDAFDQHTCKKNLRNLYTTLLGKQTMKKLIKRTFDKFSSNFKAFIEFWALFNLLLSRLSGLTESSLANPHSLNAIFNLFELNTEEPKELLTQLIPEILFETKNKMLFEIYRVHAKFWIQKKADPKLSILAGPFDEMVNKFIDLEDDIKISYDPWTNQEFFPVRGVIRTSRRTTKGPQKLDELLSETKMLDHLLKGDYNFVLNYFLLTYSSGIDKDSYPVLRQILQDAKGMEFTDENAKALYILKEINEKFFSLSEPVAFEKEFLGDFKTIKWIEKKEAEPVKVKKTSMFQARDPEEKGKFSRKRAERLDSEENQFDNKERIYSKGKLPRQGGGLFSKKNKNFFSTQKDAYAQYREVVNELQRSALSATAAEFSFGIKMDRHTDLNTFKEEVERRSREMTESNHKTLFNMNHLPIVGNGSNLLKYLFLKKPEGEAPQIDSKLKKKLQVSFVSQIGALEKDFSKYIEDCRFKFPLAQQVYVALLQDQKNNYVRKSFKTIITHIVAYRSSISDKEIELICEVTKKNRIGITLIEFLNLLIENKTFVSKQAVKTLCDTLQRFKKINGDIFIMAKKYCERIGHDFEINMIGSYFRSLLVEEQDEKLSELCEILKQELRPAPYKLKSELSPEENIRQEKQHKEFQRKESSRILKEIINIVVVNVNNKLPAFLSTLYDEYKNSTVQLEAEDIAVSLIVYCNDVEKFLEVVRSLKANPDKIILKTYECAIKAIRLNSRGLDINAEQIFNMGLFTHNFMLNEELIMRSIQIFKILSSPTVFIKFLEYLLRYNPPLNYEIKSSMYFVMNQINDDFAKNTISGLLDFIFNSNREKEREEYRKAQIIEEEKIQQLLELEKKDFFFDKTDNQKAQMIENIEEGNFEEAKNPKKNKAPEKIKEDKNKKQTAKSEKTKTEGTSGVKQSRRKLTMKDEYEAMDVLGDGVIKKGDLKKKLRSKSLNDFEEMFAQRDDILEDSDTKGMIKGGKGKGAPQKDAKEGKKKGK